MLSSVTSEASSGQTYLKEIGKTQFNWTIKDIQAYLELNKPIDSPTFSLKILNSEEDDEDMELSLRMLPMMVGQSRGSFEIILNSDSRFQFRSTLRVSCFELENSLTDGTVQMYSCCSPRQFIATGKIEQIPQDHQDMTISLELSAIESAHN